MKRDELLKEMGLGPLWKLRPPFVKPSGPPREAPSLLSAAADERTRAIAAMGWAELRQAVAECTACALHKTRKQAVLGVGDIHAEWLFIGEGPGAEEDERGEPFVGQAGKLLDAMLAAIGLKRGENVYIANAVKCRPPNNRTPEASETAACWPFLARQIELIRPKLIVALGKPAAQTLLQQEVTIAKARGLVHDFAGIALIVTYHPAYLLRNLPEKAKAWEDLCFMRKTMAGLG
ncbi:MAG: uracil-DNA glycosylase [Rhodocyclaceae bacterium]|nr:uracil-DNA glycosylase [Rhodocyclaceae bacterium]